MEENGGEDGLLAEVIEGEHDQQKITAKAVKARLEEVGNDPLYADEHAALKMYANLMQQQSEVKVKRKAVQQDLDEKIDTKYFELTEIEIKTLVVDDKWMACLSACVQSEIECVSRVLASRIHQLAERYATPLPELERKVKKLSAKVDGHLKKMGLACG